MKSFWQNNDIEMKLINVNSSPYIDSNNEKNIFSQKVSLQIGLKTFW